MVFKCYLAAVLSLGFAAFTAAETFYEVSTGPSQLALDIVRKRDPNFADDSQAWNVGMGAYRHSSDKAAWGAVIEYTQPFDRDDALAGNGKILGFRPINYLRNLHRDCSLELYAGIAQYEWTRTANGYYFGTNLRWDFKEYNLGLALDAKYYQDLAHDVIPELGEQSDSIVDGFNSGIRLYYRFN